MSHGVKSIGIIGAGQMGGGITQVAATAGIDAVVFDNSTDQLKKCEALHQKLLSRAVEKERMTQAEADAALGRISYASSLDALSGADWVVEAIVEDLGVKGDLFKKLAAMLPSGGGTAPAQ